MKRDRYSALCWLWSALLTAAIFAALWKLGGMRYENSDDILLVKSYMGFEGGVPASFGLYQHTLLAWTLYGLSCLKPSVPWFSVYQVGLLWLSGTVIAKSLLQLAGKRRAWQAALLTLVTAVVVEVFAFSRINFTTTAALAACAALMQFWTIDRDLRRIGADALWLALLAGGYCLRAQSVWPILPFLTLAWCVKFGKAPSPLQRKRLLAVLCAAAALFAALIGIRAAELFLRGLEDKMERHRAMVALYDYTDFQSDSAPALASGTEFSAEKIALLQQWYLMDADTAPEVLQTLASAYPAKHDVVGGLRGVLASEPKYGLTIALLVLLLLLALLQGDRVGRWTAVLSALGTLALALILAWRGRVLSRALDVILMPCVLMLCALILKGRPIKLKSTASVALALCVAVIAAHGLQTVRQLRKAPDAVSQQTEAELEQFALENPSLLVVRDCNLLRDTRLFPNVGAGIPANTMIWGDWCAPTPSRDVQLAAFGFDAATFSAKDWLSERIVFAASDEAGVQPLLTYLNAALEQSVEANAVATCGSLIFYAFRVAQL